MTAASIILSQQAVAEMQQNYLARMAARVSAAPADRRQDLLEYLLTADRARVKVSNTSLKQLFDLDAASLAVAAAALQRPLFHPDQRTAIDTAARQRKDVAVVTAIFGDASRLYLRPLDDGSRAIEERVTAFLATRHLALADYNEGQATDGKQTFKIGKLLIEAGEEKLDADFQADERRRLGRLMVVISRDPEDIARASTGRAWQSCLSPHKKEFMFIPGEVAFGTLVGYLVSENDPEINNPLARIFIRPYRKVEPEIEAYKAWDTGYNRLRQPLKSKFEKIKTEVKWALHGRPPGENDILYMTEQKAYGLSRGILRHTADVFTRQYLNAGLSEGDYHLPWQVYTDTLNRDARVRDGRVEILPDRNPLPYL